MAGMVQQAWRPSHQNAIYLLATAFLTARDPRPHEIQSRRREALPVRGTKGGCAAAGMCGQSESSASRGERDATLEAKFVGWMSPNQDGPCLCCVRVAESQELVLSEMEAWNWCWLARPSLKWSRRNTRDWAK